ncbi:MAG TPA: hypothetical protein VLJ58_02820, partial [Ramlibacter sp.]|nr:hypothetical protein [Ramlibacter sp.]
MRIHQAPERLSRLTCLLALALAGCVTTAGSPSAQGNNPLASIENAFVAFTVPSKFRKAVEGKDWDGASTLYDQHSALLEREAQNEVMQLAKTVNGRWAGRLKQDHARLEAAVSGSDFSPARWSAALTDSRSTLRDYDSEKVLQPAGRRSAESTALLQAIGASERSFIAAMPRHFGAYSHATQPMFFAALPVQVARADQGRVAGQNLAKLVAAIHEASPGKSKELVTAYGPLLTANERVALQSAYGNRMTAARFGPGARPGAAQRLYLAQMSAEVGGPALRVLKLDSGRAAPTVSLDGRAVQATIAPDQLESQLRSAAASGEHVVLLVDGANTAVVSELKDART